MAEPERGPVVLAPSSLTEALEEIADAWEMQGHARPVLSFAGTSSLARQVESGAPADVFVSADRDWLAWLEERELVQSATVLVIARNRLVLVMHADGDAQVSGIEDVQQILETIDGRIAMGDPDGVPAGRYAKASLQALCLWEGFEFRIVPTENVRAALALVERGEVPLGIVYASDAEASSNVEPVAIFAADLHPPIEYPAALLSGSVNSEANAFLEFLGGGQATTILCSHGFSMPDGNPPC